MCSKKVLSILSWGVATLTLAISSVVSAALPYSLPYVKSASLISYYESDKNTPNPADTAFTGQDRLSASVFLESPEWVQAGPKCVRQYNYCDVLQEVNIWYWRDSLALSPIPANDPSGYPAALILPSQKTVGGTPDYPRCRFTAPEYPVAGILDLSIETIKAGNPPTPAMGCIDPNPGYVFMSLTIAQKGKVGYNFYPIGPIPWPGFDWSDQAGGTCGPNGGGFCTHNSDCAAIPGDVCVLSGLKGELSNPAVVKGYGNNTMEIWVELLLAPPAPLSLFVWPPYDPKVFNWKKAKLCNYTEFSFYNYMNICEGPF